MEAIVPVLLGLVLAFLTESFTEYLFGQVVDHIPKLDPFRWLLQYVAAAAGVGLAFYYYVDVIATLTNTAQTDVGVLLTGLTIGRGSNYFHQFVSQYLPKKEKNRQV